MAKANKPVTTTNKPVDLAIVCADTHLQERNWRLRPILGDAYYSFSQIVNLAIELHLPVLAAGDLINRRVNEPSPIVYLSRELKRLRDAGVTLFQIQGQHEADAAAPWLSIDETVVHLHGRTVDLGHGLVATGLDYLPAGKFQEALASLPQEANVLVGHQTMGNWMGSVALPQGNFSDIPLPIETCIFGDLHQYRNEKGRGKDGQELGILSPGASYQTPSITAPADCYAHLLLSDGSFEPHKLRTRKFDEFGLTFEHELEELLANAEAYLKGAAEYAADNHLPPDLHKPLWYIVYGHKVHDTPQRLARVVGDQAHLFFKELPPPEEERKNRPAIAQVLQQGAAALSLESCLSQVVDAVEDPEVASLCQQLLASEEPERAIEQWKTSQLGE